MPPDDGARVSAQAPGGQALVAPERHLRTGRAVATDRADKHRGQDTDPARRGAPRATRPRWLLPIMAGVVALVVIAATVVALAGGGDGDVVVAAGAGTTTTAGGGEERAATATTIATGATTSARTATTAASATTAALAARPLTGFEGSWQLVPSGAVRIYDATGIFTNTVVTITGSDFELLASEAGRSAGYRGRLPGLPASGTTQVTCSTPSSCSGFLSLSVAGDQVTAGAAGGRPFGSLLVCGRAADPVAGPVAVLTQQGAGGQRQVTQFSYWTLWSSGSGGDGCAEAFAMAYEVVATRA